MPPSKLEQRSAGRFTVAGGSLRALSIQRSNAADAGMHAVIGCTDAQAEYIVAATEPPAVSRTAKVKVQFAPNRGRRTVIIAAVADAVTERFALRPIDAEVVERKTLVVPDQEIELHARYGLVIVEAEITLQIHVTPELAASVSCANGGVGVGIVATQREIEAIKRGRHVGERRRTGQKKRNSQQVATAKTSRRGRSY